MATGFSVSSVPKDTAGQMRNKACFQNAGMLALAGRGEYVEGFAMDNGQPFAHAWITLDGVHAIDPTLPDATRYTYFGIQVPVAILEKVICNQRYWGVLEKSNFDLLGLSSEHAPPRELNGGDSDDQGFTSR